MDPGQEVAVRRLVTDLLGLLQNHNSMLRNRCVTPTIVASVQAIVRLHPLVTPDSIRSVLDALQSGVALAFPDMENSN